VYIYGNITVREYGRRREGGVMLTTNEIDEG
jgi:hypothetical protein